MRVKEEDTKLVLPRDPNRSPGLHMSPIIKDYAIKAGFLDAKFAGEVDDDDDTTLIQIGLAWENYLAAYQHPEIYFHPGEMVKNGIAMSPDGISFSQVDIDWMLHEFKATLKSSRDFRESLRIRAKKVMMYLMQVMSYRYAMNHYLETMGMEPGFGAKLHMLFMRGNYAKNFDDPESRPTYKVFSLTFTPQELEENWTLLLNHARSMGHDV